jgi:hypothetical protein
MRMGFIAVKGVAKSQVLERLGEVEADHPARLYSEPAVGVSADGWVIVVKPDVEFPSPERLAAVSVGGEAVGYSGCTVVMVTSALGFRDGAQIWSVEHNSELDEPDEPSQHLETSGDLPPGFEEIIAAARKGQAAEVERVDHIFGITGDVVAGLCGFHLEQESDIAFTALEAPKKPPGLFARLFGRR